MHHIEHFRVACTTNELFYQMLIRGAFGAHVAMVLRRLVRVCLYYSGRCPQFICCSATILNPDEHIRKLIPIDSLFDHTTNNAMKLTIVSADMDGSPRGER